MDTSTGWPVGSGRRARVGRQEFYHDVQAPHANSISPTAFVIARDSRGWVLLVRRVDSGHWELPGGRIEVGESASEAAAREVAEESGVTIAVSRLAGVYSDPSHVMAYPATGEVRQEMSVCFHAVPVGGTPRPDNDETCEAAWVNPELIGSLQIHPSMRIRIRQGLSDPENAYIG